MASFLSIKRGFTLLEMTIVILLFSFIILIVSSLYLTLMRTTLIANDYYQSLENLRLGTEKIWRELKYGWSFERTNESSISFQKKDCTPTTLSFVPDSSTINYCENGKCSSLFDENLVKVKDFKIATDTPRTTQRFAYFQYAPKIIILYYDLDIKSKRGEITNLRFQQAVAPINSVYTTNLCQSE